MPRSATINPRILCLCAFVLSLGCGEGGPEAPAQRAAATRNPSASPASVPLDSTPPGEWRVPARDYASTRFAPLDQINRENVASLRPAWTFSTGVLRGHEAAPIVVGSTMYLVTPFPNYLYAIDLNQAGRVLWRYRPPLQRAAQGVACCDVVNRGAAYFDTKVFFNTLDNQTVAVDATTGQEVWRTRLGSINVGETITMAPLVVKGKVLVGNSGGEMGVRGWLTALDAQTGEVVWRAYSTGPDEDALIGPEFQPYYAQDRGEDLGVTTWPPDAWRQGGGTVWGWISYDSELDLVYYGTGNPGPWNPDQRPGANKWTAGIFARDPDTGAARWFYQFTPHDLHDYDAVNENILLDLTIGGAPRRVIVRPERNGYIYVLDRATGELISADPFVHINSSLGVDSVTGEYIPNPQKEPVLGKVVYDICPASPGAKDWQPSAFSPRTGLLYIPHNNLCMDVQSVEANYIAGTPYVGANVIMKPGPGGHRGEFTAWDPVARRPVWKIREHFPTWSGALATAGDLVFYGTMDGWFKAVDALSGDLLWSFKTESGIIGQPISYLGPDGKQFVAILSGVGGWSGAIVAAGLSPEDSTAALGFVGAMGDLPQHTQRGGTLYVFSLP
ncbi:MAG TPA: methanol/ethanol family PQQ-dependent dehydrogenase [Longimicrobiaceae bacterium]